MELDLAVSLFAGKADSILEAINREPVRRPVAGSAVVVANVNPTIVPVEMTVPDGRLWNILSVLVAGTDPHTPVGQPTSTPTGGLSTGGVANAPTAGTAVVSLTLPPGTYLINVATLASGTVAAGDNNNVQLYNATAAAVITSPLLQDATAGTNTAPNPPIPLTLAVQSVITVRAIANATAGSVYTAVISAVPQANGNTTTSPVTADVYAGQVPDPMAPPITDCIAGNMPVPKQLWFSKEVVWARSGSNVFAQVFNASVGQTLTISLNVAEYPLAAKEALVIQ